MYYNEFEPFPAQWLRNLIKAGLIAPGEVDERSIKEVKPDEIKEFTQCHFFAGIGIWSYALREAGWSDDRPVWTGSCPCQPFSAAGQGKGTDDERHLWPAWYDLIRALSPERIFGEQVADGGGLDWLDIVYPDMEKAGYTMWINDLCTAGFGGPGKRQRLYFSAVGNSGSPGLSIGELENISRKGRREERRTTAEPSQTFGVMAVTPGSRWQQASNGEGQESNTECSSGGEVSGMANTDSQHRRTEHQQQVCQGKRPREQPCRDSRTFKLANGNGNRCDQKGECETQARSNGFVGDSGISEGQPYPSPTNGFWRDADWLYCTDGKWRPAQSGTFPLATGDTGRVGKIRAYGNAINAEAAKEFIKAAMSVAP